MRIMLLEIDSKICIFFCHGVSLTFASFIFNTVLWNLNVSFCVDIKKEHCDFELDAGTVAKNICITLLTKHSGYLAG